MDIASIGAAIEGIRYAKDALKLYIDKKADAKAQEVVEQARDKLGAVHDLIYALREELLQRQTEVAGLQARIAALDDWRQRAATYALVTAPGGATVYSTQGPPQHYACPACFEQHREIQILQDTRTAIGHYICPRCTVRYLVNPRTTQSPRNQLISFR